MKKIYIIPTVEVIDFDSENAIMNTISNMGSKVDVDANSTTSEQWSNKKVWGNSSVWE